MIYLDYAATTPMSENALDVFIQASKNFYGNASSLHDIGSTAANLLEASRRQLAKRLNCEQNGIYFTSGGSESSILAISSLIEAHKVKGNHLITTKCEHASIYHLFQKLGKNGFEVTYLPVDEYGMVSLDVLKQAIKKTTILASIQHANSEIGTVQPVKKIGEILHKKKVIFHCDAVQSFGKLSIDVKEMNIDSLSLSGHKIYGPKGVGAVYINPKLKWHPQLPGTTHESGFRPGTVNVPGIASFVTAADDICESMEKEGKRLSALREELINYLTVFPAAKIMVEGSSISHLPNILGLRIIGMEGQYVMLECNRYGLAISTGSACSVGMQAPSRTMKAIGRTDEEAMSFIRLSLGKNTTRDDIIRTAEIFKEITNRFFQK
ncbi:IscS subfamily cysteine desulfurase [Caldibacillus sp. 210928-DFI.2.22]|uniref:IscS subfamily cysteine desulfurase n=1 Tax=unclassified Caldibacillus TaxID=2641266 RepID=UPI001D05F51E|nr:MULTISPECIES: IscS subfamily cysteine desulfurase [unclassified Caldibacillus]MCB7069583.1 IscS subfamily cysteine desulfurase [Caldibacillus sp. 210928-DFI.2.22]MCB7072914.1 IscS subfamily cysteine desulfurase [Caldibacillus sp. 210928-DFI.2.18]